MIKVHFSGYYFARFNGDSDSKSIFMILTFREYSIFSNFSKNSEILRKFGHKMAHIARLERGEGYGFHLASETGNQFIRKIDEKSPAEKAGIKDGDRLIGVSSFFNIFSEK